MRAHPPPDAAALLQVLATFYYKGDKYVVATPLEPVLIIGSPTVKGAAVEPELRVGNKDIQTISSLPGAGGLEDALEVGAESVWGGVPLCGSPVPTGVCCCCLSS